MRTCNKCGKEYKQELLAFDGGYCKECTGNPKETASIFNQTLLLCVFFFFIAGMIADCGVISRPAGFFYSLSILYFILRKAIFWIFGHPELTKIQKIGLSLFPLYGFPLFFIIWVHYQRYFL